MTGTEAMREAARIEQARIYGHLSPEHRTADVPAGISIETDPRTVAKVIHIRRTA